MRLEFESNASAYPVVETETVSESVASEGEQLLRAGVKAAQEGRRSEAKALLMRVTEIEPQNENAWLWLASISEYPEELLVFLNNVLRINPENARAVEWKKATKTLLAKTLVQRGVDASKEDRKNFAKQCFEQAVEHDAENELGWLWLASVVESDAERAEMFEKVLSINPENETAKAALESLRSNRAADILHDAVSEAIEGNHSAALQMLEIVLDEDPSLEEAWVLKAHLANSFEDRAESLLKVRSLNPENEMAIACLKSWRGFVEKGVVSVKTESAPEFFEAPVAEELQPVGEPEGFVAFANSPEPPSMEAIEIEHHDAQEAPEAVYADVDSEPAAIAASNEYVAPDSPTQDLNSIPAFRYPVEDHADENDEPLGRVSFDIVPEREEIDLAAAVAADEDEMSEAFDDLHRTVTPDRDTDVEYALRHDADAVDPYHVSDAPQVDDQAEEEWRNTSPEVFVGYTPAEPAAEVPAVYAEAPAEPEPAPFYAEAPAEPEPAPFYAEAPAEPEPAAAFVQPEPFVNQETVQPIVEARAERSLCPFCNSENEKQALSCASCHAVLSLTDLDAIFNHNGLNAEMVQQAVASFEREHESYGLNAEQLANLGIGQINLKNYRQGYLYLQEAVQKNPSNVVLDAQLNAFAIRLEELEKVQSAHDAMPKNRKILVVDDSPTVRKLISSKLEKCGHEVVCAVDGLDALEKLNALRPDLILLDITMPRMDGYQVCKLIRNNTDMKDVPVVMISGKDGFFDKVRGRMAGTTDYITKPFGPETLMKTVENYLN